MFRIYLFLYCVSIPYLIFVQGISGLSENDPVLYDVQRKTQKNNGINLPVFRLYQIDRNNNQNQKNLFDTYKIFCCLKKFQDRYNQENLLGRINGQSIVGNIKNQEHVSYDQKSIILSHLKRLVITHLFTQKQYYRKKGVPKVICELVNSDDIEICDNIPTHKTSDFNSKSYNHRRLLQAYSTSDGKVNKEWTEIDIVETWIGGDQSTMDNTTYNGLTLARWKEFLTTINQTLSRDHIWAMLSLVCLIIVMMLAMKVCGLKPMDRRHEIHMDYVFRDFDHTVSISEIIALKKRYLPKRVLQYTKQWKWKRKKKIAPIRHLDIVDNISDNNDDERLVYSKPINDF